MLIAIGSTLLGGCVLLKPLIRYSDRHAVRDASTGILRGAEPCEFGPKDAPCAVLFVHGFVGAGNNFWHLPELLAQQGHSVRVLRLPGHGTSPLDLVSVTADHLLEALRTEVREAKQRHARVVLVGHSMGATLATLVASELGVDGLILGAPYFGVTSRWYYGLKAETWIRLTRPIVRWAYKGRLFVQVNHKDAKRDILSYRWIPREAGDTLLELGKRVNREEVLASVTCPTLVLHSRHDIAACPAAAENALARFGGADKRMVWLPHSNHHIFWDHDRDLVAEESLQFVARIANGEAAPD